MNATLNRTLCLCCGSYYDTEGDCPHVDVVPHEIELALEVSRLLIKQGITNPDKHDVNDALKELGYR